MKDLENIARVNILGVEVDALTKAQVLAKLQKRVDSGQKTFIITPYSEFFYLTFRDYSLQDIFNSADIAIPDGIGTIWASHYLSLPMLAKSYYAKAIQAFWQLVYTGAEVIISPKKIYNILPEKISGSDFIWDLAEFAEKNSLSLYLLGGWGDESKIVAEKLQKKYPQLKIAGHSNADYKENTTIDRINASQADVLMVAFGRGRQEKWISKNLPKLKIKIVIGLGGTFDYISGTKKSPPKWVRASGLEWLFRLITQPRRFKRIWHATFSFTLACFRHKVFMSMPYRENVVGVIINNENKVLIAHRLIKKGFTPENPYAIEHHWQFPQGGTDSDSLEKALLREMGEELGLTHLKILGMAKRTHKYLWNHAYRPVLFNSRKFCGQQQIIFFLKYSGSTAGNNQEVKLDQREFDHYKWVAVQELSKVLHRFRKPLAKIVEEEMQNFIQ